MNQINKTAEQNKINFTGRNFLVVNKPLVKVMDSVTHSNVCMVFMNKYCK